VNSTVPSGTSSKVTPTELKFHACSANTGTSTDSKLSFKGRESQNSSSGGLNILKPRACYKTLLDSTERLKTGVALPDFSA
jgi:hypothetical protein